MSRRALDMYGHYFGILVLPILNRDFLPKDIVVAPSSGLMSALDLVLNQLYYLL